MDIETYKIDFFVGTYLSTKEEEVIFQTFMDERLKSSKELFLSFKSVLRGFFEFVGKNQLT
ncbi:MAG: hypothetical protein ACFFCS_12945 [Candidatus Hodarchaeota archaeon]